MKRISPPQEFYGAILHAYFDFLNLALTALKSEKKTVFCYKDKIKGVGQWLFRGQIVCNFDLSDKKISEKILVSVKYDERSKKLLVSFKAKDKDSFILALNAVKKTSVLLASFLDELVWGLAEVFLKVEKPVFRNFDYYICPYVEGRFYPLNPYYILKNRFNTGYFADDVLCILYNVYTQRQNRFCLVEMSADDIIFLRGHKTYRNSDRKRIKEAINTLCALNLIRVKKVKKYVWQFYVLQNRLRDGFLVPKEVFGINPAAKYFEKCLAFYIFYLASVSCFEFKVAYALNYLKKKTKGKRPSRIREKIESAFDYLVKIGVIEGWEYKKIDENKLCGENWLLAYAKLKIVFFVKKRDKFVSCPV